MRLSTFWLPADSGNSDPQMIGELALWPKPELLCFCPLGRKLPCGVDGLNPDSFDRHDFPSVRDAVSGKVRGPKNASASSSEIFTENQQPHRLQRSQAELLIAAARWRLAERQCENPGPQSLAIG